MSSRQGFPMPTTTRDLKRKQDKLQTSATEAASLARAERVLADQQHSVAHNLELLAEDLSDQAVAVEAEIEAIETKASESKASETKASSSA